MNIDTETIFAVATATASVPATATGHKGGIGIIRISGDRAVAILSNIFPSIKDMKSHTLRYGFLVDEGEVLDEVMVALMKAPHSYTREDVVEVNCHGGTQVMKRIMRSLARYGARLAEPGEFTKRAFLNGRIDLSQATAVADIIAAENDIALKNSIKLLSGSISEAIRSLRTDILHEVAYIEAVLDDPDGYDDAHINAEAIEAITSRMSELLQQAKQGKICKDGIRTVIIGKPNVGKSSLLNRLLGEERSIVTDIPGTTRDTITETAMVGEVVLCITDTAGIRTTCDPLETHGIERTIRHLDTADLVIFVLDASMPLDCEDQHIASLLTEKRTIVLLNKSDLCEKPLVDVDKLFPHVEKIGETYVDKADLQVDMSWNTKVNINTVSTSMADGMGLAELGMLISRMFITADFSNEKSAFITHTRHIEALEKAHASMELVRAGMKNKLSEDLYMIDMMGAYENLGRIIGETVDDDLIDEIFASFCLGK